jgi:hypothetical protein
MEKSILIILLAMSCFLACNRGPNHDGVYRIVKIVNAKNSDSKADSLLKLKYFTKAFLIVFNKKGVRISDAIDPKPIQLYIEHLKDGTWYTPSGYTSLYRDTSVVGMRLHIASLDTILFIPDKFFLSAKSISLGKPSGMIVCYLSKK